MCARSLSLSNKNIFKEFYSEFPLHVRKYTDSEHFFSSENAVVIAREIYSWERREGERGRKCMYIIY